jgi:pimeloyl-ACP methyl ester carboxylesterase
MMNTVTTSSESTAQPETTARKRGCLFTIKRVLKWFGIVLVTLVLLGVAYQTIGTEIDKRNYAPRGQLYNVNGHQMHIYCVGDGSPTVILQAGGAAESFWWYWVQNQMAAHTRVCAYDRAGLGWSEPADSPRDPVTIVGELHTLLEEAGVQPPYVMAGHSYGGILTRIYAAQYPEEVTGVVMVDSMLMEAKNLSKGEFDGYRTLYYSVQIPLWALSRLGVSRFTASGTFQSFGYPPDIVPEMVALSVRNQTVDTDFAEKGFDAMWTLMQVSATAENLRDLPMVILWASESNALYESTSTGREFRDELATYSSNSLSRIIEGTNHATILGNEQYAQQVTDAILDVMNAAQTGEPLVQ